MRINAWSDLSLRPNICTGSRAVCVFEVGGLYSPSTAPMLPKLAASSAPPSSGAVTD